MKKEYIRSIKPLNFIVQCRWPMNAYWETIAGFNCYEAATVYAQKNIDAWQKDANPLRYRVLQWIKGKWMEISL